MIFSKNQHINRMNASLKNGAIVILSLRGGHAVSFVGDVKTDSGCIEGHDVDGDLCTVDAAEVIGYTLSAPKQPAPGEAALFEAFRDLRVACEASTDPAVMQALAYLVKVEEESQDAAEGDAGER